MTEWSNSDDTNTLLWICFHFHLFCIELKFWTEAFYNYKSDIPLFTIILNNLMLYQKFLNGSRRTIYIFVYPNFVALPFTWSALFCLAILLSISIQKYFWYVRILHYWLTFLVIEIEKLFSGSARTSENNSSLFSFYRPAFSVALPFLSAMITCTSPWRSFLWL